MDSDVLIQVWRTGAIAMGAALLGMAFIVVREYVPIAVRTGRAMPRHVALIATSYCLIVLSTLVSHTQLLLEHHDFTYRLVLNPVGYALGLWALTVILRDLRSRGG